MKCDNDSVLRGLIKKNKQTNNQETCGRRGQWAKTNLIIVNGMLTTGQIMLTHARVCLCVETTISN